MTILGKRVGALVIAYNAERTLEDTIAAIPRPEVDHIVVCDDGSTDRTCEISHRLDVETHCSRLNRGAGANTALGFDVMLAAHRFDIIVLLHGDNQYDPRCIPSLAEPIAMGRSDMVLGSRHGWKQGGMPLYKRIGNTLLTGLQNAVYRRRLQDYATGYKAFSVRVLETVNYRANRPDFEFDPQLNAQVIAAGFRVQCVPVPTRYFREASSVDFRCSLLYGVQTLRAVACYALHRRGVRPSLVRRMFLASNCQDHRSQ